MLSIRKERRRGAPSPERAPRGDLRGEHPPRRRRNHHGYWARPKCPADRRLRIFWRPAPLAYRNFRFLRAPRNVPPPATLRPGETAWVYTPKNCAANETSNLNNASTILGKALAAALFPNPDLGPPTTFDAHHVKPSCFGGSNLATNGIWLPNIKASVDLHTIFTTWFFVNGASLVGANFTP
jgi:hypothetical protein